jgi:hypothetical protein
MPKVYFFPMPGIMVADLPNGNVSERIVGEWSAIHAIGTGITPVRNVEKIKSRMGLKDEI